MALARVPEREWPRLEQGCMYGWMNGVNSDNALSIQTMVTRTMVTRRWLVRRYFLGTWLLQTWFGGTWLL